MSRVIKFRAWDDVNEKMFEWHDIQNMRLDLSAFDARPEIFMQFTGLKDKNGKECFEEDIVVHPGQGTICKIVFELGLGYGFRDAKNVWQGQLHTGLNFEIIGNLYENPELLKV